MNPVTLVTGAQGCIGAWVVRGLVERGERAVVFDLGEEPKRLLQVMDPEALASVEFVVGDVTDYPALRRALESSGAERVIHLAGLQVPFCAADPALGARVNVLGTIHVFEAARELGLARVVYASSAAVYGAGGGRPVDEEVEPEPGTHYGVYKRANEGNARVYWLDHGISSIGLRPLTVYGVARDQGLTSGPTRAMKAAVMHRPFKIGFTGATDFLHASDAASAFLASSTSEVEGAHVFNLHGDSVDVSRIIELIDAATDPEARGKLRCEGPELPIAAHLDGAAIRSALGWSPSVSLEKGVSSTMERFRELLAQGRLDTHDLEA